MTEHMHTGLVTDAAVRDNSLRIKPGAIQYARADGDARCLPGLDSASWGCGVDVRAVSTAARGTESHSHEIVAARDIPRDVSSDARAT